MTETVWLAIDKCDEADDVISVHRTEAGARAACEALWPSANPTEWRLSEWHKEWFLHFYRSDGYRVDGWYHTSYFVKRWDIQP